MKQSRWVAISIVVVAAALRLSRVPDLGYFMLDEERDAFLVRRLLVDHRPLLVGGVVPGGVSLGPLFFYISAIPYAISQLNPIGPAYGAGIIGVLGVLGVFVVGKELFDRRVGVLAMVFAAFSLLNIVYHRPWWPLTMSQVVSLMVYLSLFHLIRKRPGPGVLQGQALSNIWMPVLVISLVIGAQSDPSTLSLIPLSIIWLWRFRHETMLTRKYVLIALLLFFLAHASWIAFEFRHDFHNTRAIIVLFQTALQGQEGQALKGLAFFDGVRSVLTMTAGLIYRLFFITGSLDVTKQISPDAEFLAPRMAGIWWLGVVGMLFAIGYWVIGSLWKGRSFAYAKDRPFLARQLLSLHVVIAFSGILIFTVLQPGYVHEWLWSFMFPAIFLIAADVLAELGKLVQFDKLIWLAVAGWAMWQISQFENLGNVAGLGKKLDVVRQAQATISDEPYELRSEGSDALRYGGWRYLFTLYGDAPVKSYMDYVYEGWLYRPSGKHPETVITVINARDSPPSYTKTPADL